MIGYQEEGLTDLLEQVDAKMRLLTGLVYGLARGVGVDNGQALRVLRTRQEVEVCMTLRDCDLITLTRPDQMPLILHCSDLGWVQGSAAMAEWLTEHWTPELVVIVVPSIAVLDIA